MELADELRQLLREPLGKDVSITGLRRLSGGASRETWSFDADGIPLILRRDPPNNPKHGMALEAAMFAAADKAGVPVPKVFANTDTAIVMERLEGETIARKILRDEEFVKARPILASQCGEILARLHAIDPASVPGLEEQDEVAKYRDVLDNLGQPHPAFELGFRWLNAHRPPSTRLAVIHGDFRNGNLIIGPDGVRAVLDWELAHLGDPMEDLGWLCVKAWRFGVNDKPVGGFGSYDQLVEAYEAASGESVDREVLRWWETLGTLKWGIMCIMQGWAHWSGASRSVELAAIGRRVCENEWDLLELLGNDFGG